jgi:hypothetical protein
MSRKTNVEMLRKANPANVYPWVHAPAGSIEGNQEGLLPMGLIARPS